MQAVYTKHFLSIMSQCISPTTRWRYGKEFPIRKLFKEKTKSPLAALRGLLATWQVRWGKAPQHTSQEHLLLRGIKGLSRHILALKPAAVFHDPLTPLRSDRFSYAHGFTRTGFFVLVKPWVTSKARQNFLNGYRTNRYKSAAEIKKIHSLLNHGLFLNYD